MAGGGNTSVGVTFRANGNDLASYMDRMTQRAQELNRQALQGAQQQTAAAREQLKILEQQIALQQRRNATESANARIYAGQQRDVRASDLEDYAARRDKEIKDRYASGAISAEQRDKEFERLGDSIDNQTQLNERQYKEELRSIREEERANAALLRLQRENLDTVKTSSQDSLRQMRQGDREMVSALHESNNTLDNLAANIAEEQFEKDRPTDPKKVGAREIFGSILGVDNINKFLSAASTFTSTQNGFDLIKPAAQGAGQIIGAVIGGLIGGLTTGGTGTLVGAGIGGSIGSTIGGGVGEFEQRRAMAVQQFQANANRYRALTIQRGADSLPDMSYMGISGDQYLDLMRQSALRRGTVRGSEQTATDIAQISKGVGVEQNTLLTLSEIQRSNSENNRSLANLVGNIIGRGTRAGIFAGDDVAFLDEFLNKFAQVQKDFLKNQTVVGTATTVDLMTRIGGLGGMFDLRDPRSMSNFSAIQSGLSNPGSDSMKALSFLTLRRAMPGAGLFDILRAQQQGLSGPKGMEYLQGVLGFANQTGGDDDMRRLMISGMFPGLSLDAVDTLYKNQGKLSGPIDRGFLEGTMTSGNFQVLAENNTTVLERNMADIQNGLLGAWNITLDRMVGSFEGAISAALSGATIQLQNGRLVIPGGSAQPIQQNTTATPTQYRNRGIQNPNWASPYPVQP